MSCCKKGPNWSESETRVFLELCIDKQIINIMDGKRYKHIDIFKTLVPEMENKGYFKTAEQMKLKLRNLKQSYFKCKRQNSVSGAGKNICQFYEELDLLYGGRPNILAIDNDGIDTALFNEDTATEEEINAQEVETTSDEHNLLQELHEEQYELTDTDDTDGIRTPKRKQDKSGESSKKKYQKFEYAGRKSYEAALNSFSEKMLEGQRNILESILQKQTTSCADIFQREMEAQRKWEEEMMEKEREFQKEQTSVIIQNFQQSLQTLHPTTQMLNPYTPLKLIPMQQCERNNSTLGNLSLGNYAKATKKGENIVEQN